MVYRGKIQNGVVTFDGAPPFPEGASVRVELECSDAESPRRGTAQAILSSKARWHGTAEEMDRLLAEIKEMKRAELLSQSSHESLP